MLGSCSRNRALKIPMEMLPVDWQPKTWEARDIEGPDELLNILKELPRRG